jgi:predicted AlkP superfamily phosphohydrolase/phosphomutase
MEVLVISLDGVPWKILDSLEERGDIPNITELKKNGVHTDMISTAPPSSPSAWTSFQTGKTPDEHEIVDFTRVEDGYNIETNSLPNSDNETIWEKVNNSGKTAVPLNVPMLFPADDQAPKMVSGLPAPKIDRSSVYPDTFRLDINSSYPHYSVTPDAPDDYKEDSIRDAIEDSKRSVEDKFSVASEVIEEDDPELLMLHIHDTDSLQHCLWPYCDPVGDVMADFYSKIDEEIGRLLDTAGDVQVFLVSDHGFRDNQYEINLNKWLLDKGYIHSDKSTARKNWLKEAAKMVLPEKFLNLYRSRKREEGSQTVGDKIMEDRVTHEGTTAFAHGKGRGKIYLLDNNSKSELVEDLYSMKFNGEKVVEDVKFYSEMSKKSPNLIVEPKEPYSFKHAMDEELLSEVTKGEDKHLGTHSKRGIFIANGDMMNPGEVDGIKIEDIQPLILEILDLDHRSISNLKSKVIE